MHYTYCSMCNAIQERYGSEVTCREYEKMIPDFIQKKMTYLTMKEFLRHTNSCESCKEELVIQFLIAEGMASLEDGDVFDLQTELDERIAEARKRVNRNDTLFDLSLVMEAVIMLAILVIVGWILI